MQQPAVVLAPPAVAQQQQQPGDVARDVAHIMDRLHEFVCTHSHKTKKTHRIKNSKRKKKDKRRPVHTNAHPTTTSQPKQAPAATKRKKSSHCSSSNNNTDKQEKHAKKKRKTPTSEQQATTPALPAPSSKRATTSQRRTTTTTSPPQHSRSAASAVTTTTTQPHNDCDERISLKDLIRDRICDIVGSCTTHEITQREIWPLLYNTVRVAKEAQRRCKTGDWKHRIRTAVYNLHKSGAFVDGVAYGAKAVGTVRKGGPKGHLLFILK